MTLKWQDIDRAIEDLILHERGIDFQRIAISLAKIHWPEVVATEVKKDGGEDGLTHSYLTKDGKRFDVASSITNTYEKVKGDLKSIYERGVILDLLIFYTPKKVFNRYVDDWKRKVRGKFGCELLVISRENIIHELLQPQNHWICSTFLGLDVPTSPTVNDVTQKAIDATHKVLDQWKVRSRFGAARLIDLDVVKLDEKKMPTGEIFSHHAICMHLGNGGRSILLGGPGSGKTTTLIQICESLLTNGRKKVPLLVSLPEWIESGKDMLSFITKHPYFIATGISPTDLALLHESGLLVFVLNGWNEMPAHLMAVAGRQLARLDREFPASGIIVATREFDYVPPLLGALNLRLNSITNSQRRIFINSVLSERAGELLSRIEADEVLSEITRTPLILSELTEIFKLGWEVPRTRFSILQGVIRRTEESEEHSIVLQSEPICGRSTEYLKEISADMTQEGRTVLHEAKALSVISSVNESLKAAGQTASLPDPKLTLDMLCAHHLLEKSKYPIPSIFFIHQQFQELYAAIKVREKISNLVKAENVDEISKFQFNIINIPTWEEPLKLIAEEISERTGERGKEWPPHVDAFEMGLHLVKWSIPIDPIFAAHLARLCGLHTWEAVKEDFGALLRRWYNYPHKAHKACSLAAMFASGADDFSDIIWPLLEHPDQQVRLQTYRTPNTFFLTCLGNDWQNRVAAWDAKHRKEFVSEVSHQGGSEELDAIEKFALKDPSIEVRVTAMTALGWRGAISKFYQLVGSCDDATFRALVINADYLFKNAPDDLWPKIRSVWKKVLSKSKDLNQRLRILLRLCEANEQGVVDQTKAALEDCTVEDFKDYRGLFLKEVLERVTSEDPDWTSNWIARRQAEGLLLGEQWSTFLDVIPNEIITDHFDSYLDPEYPESNARRVFDLIAKGATGYQILKTLQKMIELRRTFDTTTDQPSELQRNLYWRLRDLLHAFSLSKVVQVILDHQSKPKNVSELFLILDFLGRSDLIGSYVRESLQEETLENLRLLLRDYHNAVLGEDDFMGELKSLLSTALSIFGEPKDLSLIESLIRADIKRRRQGEEAFRNGERHTPKVHGFRVDYSDWHVRALCRLDPENAEELILKLIEDRFYESAAGTGLIQMLKSGIDEEVKPQFGGDYNCTFKSASIRPVSYISKIQQQRFSAALVTRINTLKQARKSTDNQDNLNYRLKRLATILSTIDGAGTEALVLEIMALPGEWDGWTRVGALEALIQNGIQLDMASVEHVLNPTIQQLFDRGIYVDRQNAWLLKRCLCLFAKTSDHPRAIERIREITLQHLSAHDMRDLIVALVENRSREAAKYLIELAQNEAIFKISAPEIIKALANSRSPEGTNALLSMIDPGIKDTKLPKTTDYHTIETLAQNIAGLCLYDKEINDRVLALFEEHLPDAEREIAANIVLKLSSPEAVIKGLNLISDKSGSPVPYSLWQALKNIILNHVPVSGLPNSYKLEPREATEIRSRLFDMAMDDKNRNRSAFGLLGAIDQLRLEYGNPATEPRHPKFKRGEPWPIMQFFE